MQSLFDYKTQTAVYLDEVCCVSVMQTIQIQKVGPSY